MLETEETSVDAYSLSQKEVEEGLLNLHGAESFYDDLDRRDQELPSVKWAKLDGARYQLSTLSVHRADVAKFLHEVLQKWSVVGERAIIDSAFFKRFKFYELEDETYTLSQLIFFFETNPEEEVIEASLRALEKEIHLGLRSIYHARKILEMKGFTSGEKTGLIREKITELVHRFPSVFDYDIFDLLQKYFVETRGIFWSLRSYKHLLKLVCILYLYWKKLLGAVDGGSRKREVLLKVSPEWVDVPFGKKEVLTFVVGVNFIKENERFGKMHLLKAVKRFVPEAKLIEDAYFGEGSVEDRYHVFYVEMEKEGKKGFSEDEVHRLQTELISHLKEGIETLVRPIFMPRNEEEVMKYLQVLAGQVTEEKDVAQIAILFDEQTEKDLVFTIALARPLTENSKSLKNLIYHENQKVDLVIEKLKKLGQVADGIGKEAAVLRMRISNTPFLRDDYAVDLYKARQKIVSILMELFGEVRDYNGGMIAKQMQVLTSFKAMLQESSVSNGCLIENFFHSLYPVELRSIVHPEILKEFFMAFHSMTALKDQWLDQSSNRVIFFTFLEDPKVRDRLFSMIASSGVDKHNLLELRWQTSEGLLLGFLYITENVANQQIFLQRVQEQLC